MSGDLLRPQPAEAITPPVPSSASAPYWEACARGELVYLHCSRCVTVLMPPTSTICWRCLSRELAWSRSTGRGLLRTWTTVWRAPSPGFEVPYAPAVVTFEEGFDHVTCVVGCTVSELRPDLPVEVHFAPAGAPVQLPYVRPAG